MKNKFFSTTVGRDVQVFVSPKDLAAYGDSATTVAGLVAKTEGTIVILNADNTVRSTALTAGTKFRIAQVNAQKIKYSPILTFAANSVTKTAYVAPVKQVTTISGLAGSVDINVNYALEILDTTQAVEPLPRYYFASMMEVAGKFMVDVLIKIAKQCNDTNSGENYQYGKVATMEVYNAQNSGTAITATAATIVDSDQVTFSEDAAVDGVEVGAFISIATLVYKVVAATSTTVFTIDRPWTAARQSTATTNLLTNDASLDLSLVITAEDFGSHFRVAQMEEFAGVVTYTTDFKQGSGTPAEVSALEKEGWVRDGHGTQNVAFAADYGQPNSLVSTTGAYTLYNVKLNVSETAIAGGFPQDQHVKVNEIVIAVDAGDATITTLNTIFGV